MEASGPSSALPFILAERRGTSQNRDVLGGVLLEYGNPQSVILFVHPTGRVYVELASRRTPSVAVFDLGSGTELNLSARASPPS
jgi:hypothetical protein